MNQKETKQIVEANNVVTLRADKTQTSPEVDKFLRQLGNESATIPYVAIFPAGNPNKPIRMDGVFTSPAPIVEALKKAGPSKGAGPAVSTAMTTPTP